MTHRPQLSTARWRTVVASALALPLLAAAAVAPAAEAATSSSGQVYILQGVAGQTASVLVDDRSVASSVAARTVVGPVSVAPGRHTVQLRGGAGTIAQASFTVASGSSTDLVVHRFPDASESPGFTAFTNDLSPVPPGKTRLRVAHTAVVPPADIVVNGKVLIRNIANGESSTDVVPEGSYTVAIVPTATTGPAVLGPTTLRLGSGTLTNVFAIGDPKAGTMDAIVQVLPVSTEGSSAPSRVDTGDGGQAAGLFARPWSGGTALALLGLLPVMALLGWTAGRPSAARSSGARSSAARSSAR